MTHRFTDTDKRRWSLSLLEDCEDPGDMYLTIEVATPTGTPKILTACAYLPKAIAQQLAADLLGMPIEDWAAKRVAKPLVPFGE